MSLLDLSRRRDGSYVLEESSTNAVLVLSYKEKMGEVNQTKAPLEASSSTVAQEMTNIDDELLILSCSSSEAEENDNIVETAFLAMS